MKGIKTIAVLAMALMVTETFATPVVTDVVAKQRYPWNGLVDITCKVSGIDENTKGWWFFLSAVFPDSDNIQLLSKNNDYFEVEG